MYSIIERKQSMGGNFFFFKGLSTDTKPHGTGMNGSVFYEMDSGIKYHYNEDTQSWIPEGLSKYLASIAITTPPTKVDYTEGESFIITGLVVTATYTDDTTATIDNDKLVVMATEPLTLDDTSVTFKYTENGIMRSVEQPITVSTLELTGIEFTYPPDKTSYIEGEHLDLTGAVVTATFSDGSTAEVTGQCEFEPQNGDVLTFEDSYITASYKFGVATEIATTAVTVSHNELRQIVYTAPPTKINYVVGELLDLSGAVVTATYTNGATADVTNECTFVPANGTELTEEGATDIVASYTVGDITKQATTFVMVTHPEMDDLTILQYPTKRDYIAGENLDVTGIEVSVKYKDGTVRDVTNLCTYVPEAGTPVQFGTSEVVVYYYEGSSFVKVNYAITVTNPAE